MNNPVPVLPAVSSGNIQTASFDISHLNPARYGPKNLGSYADEYVLPLMMNYPGDKLGLDEIVSRLKKEYPGSQPTRAYIRAALKHLEAGGEVLERSDGKWVALRGGEGWKPNPKLEKGNWPAYNAKAIVSNVALVFKTRDINKLNGTAYKFISLHMGFIAHYNLMGFRDTYEDLEEFAKALQTSEYGGDYDHNLHEAQRQETDRQFAEWYGAKHQTSVAETIRGIVAVARKYYPGRGTQRMFNPGRNPVGSLVRNPVYATLENMRKYQGRPGLVMYSPSTGETFSANIGDYFWAPPGHKFKDSTGHVMVLGEKVPETVRKLNPRYKVTINHGKGAIGTYTFNAKNKTEARKVVPFKHKIESIRIATVRKLKK